MSKKNNVEHFIAKKVGKAINQYKMISSADKVLVGVSGGKDSLTLLKILMERKKWLPIDYQVKAIHVFTDYDKNPQRKKKLLEEFFEELGCEYVFKHIEIAKKNTRRREDCFWCAWNRRKVLFKTADELGFRKVALGHHKDDVVETIMMNLIYNGEISSINPVQVLFKGKINIIRPLILLEEKEIVRYTKLLGIETIKSECPRNNDSKRAVVKKLIYDLHKTNRDVKTNILRAPTRIKHDYIMDISESGEAIT